MRTPFEIEEFSARLTGARISLSSPRAHRATEEFKDGADADSCIEEAVAHEASARNMWIETALDPWCKRHGITREQGLSIAFNDDSFNPQNPEKDLVTRERLFAWGGQQNDFAFWLMQDRGSSSNCDTSERLPVNDSCAGLQAQRILDALAAAKDKSGSRHRG